MATLIAMPKLSATMEEATIAAWRRAAGDQIAQGDIILEVETDKATVTIEAPASGVLGVPKVDVGQVARVGEPLVLILGANENEPLGSPRHPEAGKIPDPQLPGTLEARSSSADSASVSGGRRVRASPLARRLARERTVDLGGVQGSGPNGRIVKGDVGVGSSDSRLRAQRQIAARVAASRREIPAFTLSRWIDLEGVMAEIAKFERERSVTDYFLYALACAVDEVPQFRCIWNASTMQASDLGSTNVGLVVDTDRGVVIPTLADIGGIDLAKMAVRRKTAVAAARSGRLSETLLARASLSLSSLLREDVDEFEAIIDPDQTAILAVGRLMPRAVPYQDDVAVRRGCSVKLSADHRHIDGRTAARFIGAITRVLEQRVAP
jgi:pyruvate dehydrogenase E2 component (dihydrolipoamide acetyltransferase)